MPATGLRSQRWLFRASPGPRGAAAPTGISFDATVASNFTQIFRTAFTVTETLRATNLRTGDKEDEMATKALKLHMQDIERAMFFGKKNEANASTAQPTRFTGGLISTITNVNDKVISSRYAGYR